MNISFHKNRTAKQKRNKRGALRTANKNKGTNICTHQHRHNPVNRHTTQQQHKSHTNIFLLPLSLFFWAIVLFINGCSTVRIVFFPHVFLRIESDRCMAANGSHNRYNIFVLNVYFLLLILHQRLGLRD